MSKQSGWVTINGVHVFIDGKSGKITQGPAKFIGSTLNDLPSNKGSQADLKARLQAKKENKSDSSNASNDSDTKKEKGSTTNKSSSTKASKTSSKKSSSHSFEDVAEEKYIKSSHTYKVKFNDGTTVKLNESEYDKLYSGPKFDKALEAKEKKLLSLEGKLATEDTVKAAYDTRLGRSLVGGYTNLTNKFGERVEISSTRAEAHIVHNDGSRSIVYGSSYKELANNINDRSQHYNAPKSSTAKTNNKTFDNAVTTTKKTTSTSSGISQFSKKVASTSNSTPKTGNSTFDNATSTTKKTTYTQADFENANVVTAKTRGAVSFGGKFYRTSTGYDGKVFVETSTKSIPLADFKELAAKYAKKK